MAYTVTITGTGGTNCIVTINGTDYTKASTVSVDAGTYIDCYVSTSSYGNPQIVFNGTTVASGSDSTYGFAVVNNVQITLSTSGFGDNKITITMDDPPDPLAPKDGHNTLIDGTACQIEGGTVNLGGVEYEIEKGMVLIGGTVYEIPFAGGACTVTITVVDGNAGTARVTIEGTTYDANQQYEKQSPIEIVVPNGTIASCYAKNTRTTQSTGKIIVNGAVVASSRENIPAEYDYTITGDTVIALNRSDLNNSKIRITEE